MLEPWVTLSVLLPSCSSRFICMWMWDHLVPQPLPCFTSSLPGCLSLPLLLVCMNVSSLTPWLLDFHTVRFSVISGCFLFLNLLLFFWLCEEAECVYLCLHLGQKLDSRFFCFKAMFFVLSCCHSIQCQNPGHDSCIEIVPWRGNSKWFKWWNPSPSW